MGKGEGGGGSSQASICLLGAQRPPRPLFAAILMKPCLGFLSVFYLAVQ